MDLESKKALYSEIREEIGKDRNVTGLEDSENTKNLKFTCNAAGVHFELIMTKSADSMRMRAEAPVDATDGELNALAEKIKKDTGYSTTGYGGKVVIQAFVNYKGMDSEKAHDELVTAALKFKDFLEDCPDIPREMDGTDEEDEGDGPVADVSFGDETEQNDAGPADLTDGAEPDVPNNDVEENAPEGGAGTASSPDDDIAAFFETVANVDKKDDARMGGEVPDEVHPMDESGGARKIQAHGGDSQMEYIEREAIRTGSAAPGDPAERMSRSQRRKAKRHERQAVATAELDFEPASGFGREKPVQAAPGAAGTRNYDETVGEPKMVNTSNTPEDISVLYGELDSMFEKYRQQAEDRKKALDDYSKALDTRQKQLEDEHAEKERMYAAVEKKMTAKKEKQDAELSAERKRLDEEWKQYDFHKKQLDVEKKNLEDRENDVEERVRYVDKMKELIGAPDEAELASIEDLKEQVASLKGTIASKTASIDGMKGVIDTLSAEKEAFAGERATWEKKEVLYKDKIVELSKRGPVARETVKPDPKQEKRIEKLQKEAERKESKIRELEEKNAELAKKAENAGKGGASQDELDRLEEKNRRLSRELRISEDEKEAATRKAAEAEEALAREKGPSVQEKANVQKAQMEAIGVSAMEFIPNEKNDIVLKGVKDEVVFCLNVTAGVLYAEKAIKINSKNQKLVEDLNYHGNICEAYSLHTKGDSKKNEVRGIVCKCFCKDEPDKMALRILKNLEGLR